MLRVGSGASLILGVGALVHWLHQSLGFLEGHEIGEALDHGQAYTIPGDIEELSKRLDKPLTGFVRVSEKRWADERRTQYSSTLEAQDVFFVQKADQIGQVTVWVQDLRRTWFDFFIPRPRCDPWCAQRLWCKSKLKQVSGAKASWALETRKSENDAPIDADLFGPNSYIRKKPPCPTGGGSIQLVV